MNYEVYCWVLHAEIESCNLHKLNADKQELIVPNIPHNTTIFFKVFYLKIKYSLVYLNSLYAL